MAAKIANVQEVEPSRLKFYSRNAKIHGESQIDALVRSIQEFGFVSPCLIDKDLNLIAGHGRVLAAQRLGMDTVPCVEIEGLTEEQRRAYILADNKLAEMADWDLDLISQEIRDLQIAGFDITITGFSTKDILEDIDDLTMEDFDFTTGVRKETRTKLGDIWQLGDHRLMCADSTQEQNVQRLTAGETIDLLLTDPPYNVDVTGETPDALKIQNDSMDDETFYRFINKAIKNAAGVMRPGAAFYVWHAFITQAIFEKAIQDGTDLEVHQQLIWVKDQAKLGRSDYQWMHEPCFYGWKKGADHYFVHSRRQTTVHETEGQKLSTLRKQDLIDLCEHLLGLNSEAESTVARFMKPRASREHPTMKPVELMAWQMRNSTARGDCVLDLFGGGGCDVDRSRAIIPPQFRHGTGSRLLRHDPRQMGKTDRTGGAADEWLTHQNGHGI